MDGFKSTLQALAGCAFLILAVMVGGTAVIALGIWWIEDTWGPEAIYNVVRWLQWTGTGIAVVAAMVIGHWMTHRTVVATSDTNSRFSNDISLTLGDILSASAKIQEQYARADRAQVEGQWKVQAEREKAQNQINVLDAKTAHKMGSEYGKLLAKGHEARMKGEIEAHQYRLDAERDAEQRRAPRMPWEHDDDDQTDDDWMQQFVE